MQTSVQERLNVDNSGCPLVSVVVPVYGVERFIERCARSVFEQGGQKIAPWIGFLVAFCVSLALSWLLSKNKYTKKFC